MVDLDLNTLLSQAEVRLTSAGIGAMISGNRSPNSFIKGQTGTSVPNYWISEKVSPWVVTGFDLDIKVYNISEFQALFKEEVDYTPHMSQIRTFDRRIDAEEHKLKRIMTYILSINAPSLRYWPKVLEIEKCYWVSETDKKIYNEMQVKLDNLEIDHPEWLI